MFGSDFPMWSPEADIEAFFDLDLTESERRAILWDNACRVFSIS